MNHAIEPDRLLSIVAAVIGALLLGLGAVLALRDRHRAAVAAAVARETEACARVAEHHLLPECWDRRVVAAANDTVRLVARSIRRRCTPAAP